MVYVGQTRSSALIERLMMAGWGEMTCRGEMPPRRAPWAYDNGAFKDWTGAQAFDVAAFERDVVTISRSPRKPEFLVMPDVVAGGVRSLDLSVPWARMLNGLAPRYLAVQDGMQDKDIEPILKHFEGVFIGGTLSWKIATGAAWVQFAHAHQKPCHIGRVGTFKRVRWARRINADSIDSCLPLWSEENLGRFVEGLSRAQQPELWATSDERSEEAP